MDDYGRAYVAGNVVEGNQATADPLPNTFLGEDTLYQDLGLRVTVNTDNRLITDTSVSKELWLVHTQVGLSLKEIKRILRNGFKSAFLPFHVKQAYLRRIHRELARFHDDGTIDPVAEPEAESSVGTVQAPTAEGPSA